jgi:RNA polymerase-interacting CarD/CdnL/TRCF family regulator
VTVTPAPRVPKYLALERKEARLRGDQVDSLASLARRVNRQKSSRGGERITENTLIRVAVDWLLSQKAYVKGSTEEEIRRSLGVRHDAP